MDLTIKDAREIAEAFRAVAEEVDAYLDANFKQISSAEYESLNESFKTLLRASSFATTVAVGLAINSLEDPGTALNNVIQKAKEKINALQSVGSIIRLVANLTDLAAGIMARDPGAVITAFINLSNQVNQMKVGKA